VLSTILHVEDDPGLAEIIQLLFEDFGFRGRTINAATVEEAQKVLDDRARESERIDLIISDMNLPDGSGLDVVRCVRSSLSWEQTPIVILSGDPDPRKVGRAYALGANAYVAKASSRRSMNTVIRTLYDHWARDVLLPNAQPDRAHALLARAVSIRCRRARLFQATADQCGDHPSESAFWLSRALSEGNLANMLKFLELQIEERHLSAELLDAIAKEQTDSELALDAIERERMQRPIITIDDAYRRMLDLVSISRLATIARSLSCLFPVAPVAMAALRDLLVSNALDVAAWIEMHTHEPTLRDRAAKLRADVRAMLPDRVTKDEDSVISTQGARPLLPHSDA
jgi:DNA-binding response OmpR family regulator